MVADYAEEGPRDTRWHVENVVKYHRTTGTVVSAVLASGMTLTALVEPAPTSAALASRPDLVVHRQRPALLLIRAQQPA